MKKNFLLKVILFIVRVSAAYGMWTGKTLFLKKPKNVLYRKSFITALKSLSNKTGFIHITFKISFYNSTSYLLSSQICLPSCRILRNLRSLKDDQTTSNEEKNAHIFYKDARHCLLDYLEATNRLTSLIYLTRLIFFFLNKFIMMGPQINLVACIIYENEKI